MALLVGACGGAVAPTNAPIMTPTAIPTTGPTATLSPSATPTSAPEPTPIVTADLAMSAMPRAAADPSAATQVVSGINEMGIEVLRRIGTADGNAVISPSSIAFALALARLGAVGETAAEMDAVLGSTNPTDLAAGLNALDRVLAERSGTFADADGQMLPVSLELTNAVFGQRSYAFGTDFLDALASSFGAGLRLADFRQAPEAARQTINAWVAEQTKRRIPELLRSGDLDASARMILVNAVYLKAPWQDAFRRADTKTGTFTRANGTTVRVPMMSLSSSGLGPNFGVATAKGWRAIDLPYLGSDLDPTARLSMTIIVPHDLATFERDLTAARLAKIIGALESHKVVLTMPRFGIQTRADLVPILAAMGMRAAVDANRANFSGITTEDRLYIKRVIHQANIDVDEKGTEAAAATAVVMMVGGPGDTSKPVTIRVDRPFLFALRDDATGAVLFLGHVTDPSVGR